MSSAVPARTLPSPTAESPPDETRPTTTEEADEAAAAGLTRQLEENPFGFDFFQLLRHLECLHPDRPGFGRSLRRDQDPLRLGQEPGTAFAPSAIAGYQPAESNRPARLSVHFFGLFGPNGPLPLHLTQYARRRARVGDSTFRDFADIFHHRMLGLLYRAWAQSQPTVQLEHPERDRFSFHVGALGGFGTPPYRERDALPDRVRLAYVGLLAGQHRQPDALLNLLRDYFRLPVSLREFVGEWLAIPLDSQTALGVSPATGRLGRNAVAGARSWQRQHRFRIVFGPLVLEAFEALLPSEEGARFAMLRALVRLVVGDEYAWDVQLVLRRDQVPAARLGRYGRLGRTAWFETTERPEDAADVIVEGGLRPAGG